MAAFTSADRVLRTQMDLEAVRNIWLLLGSAIVLLTVINVIRQVAFWLHIHGHRHPPTPSGDPEKRGHLTPPPSPPLSRITRALLSAATAFRIAAFRLPVPIGPNALATISELVFIFGYIAANFLWLFLDTRNLDVNFYKSRAALMASAQLPLVVALASKNNLISWLTGISHEKLNVLHRAAGRTLFIMLWVHTIGRATTSFPPHVTFNDYFMQAGIVGIAGLTAGVFLSLRIFRQAAFEFFFVTHIAFMLIFLVGGYIHLHEQGYGFYVWPALLVWGLDRSFRLIRLLWHNRYNVESCSKAQAMVELLTPDTIRLTFKRKFHWKPGQHAYVSVPKISTLPSEAHPFTIASIADNLDDTKSDEKDVVFLIRTRSGFTRQLRAFAESGESKIAAYVDGPYGSPPNLHRYSTCVLVAGGSGISYTLPLLLDLIRRSSIGGSSEVQRILFIWIVRGDGHLPWITETLSRSFPKAKHLLDIEAHIYVTGANVAQTASPFGSVNSISKSEQDRVYIEPECNGNLPQIHHGRPDISDLLQGEIASSSGPVSVDVAGPGALTASVRAALSTGVAAPGSTLKGTPSVTLHVETFGMVQN